MAKTYNTYRVTSLPASGIDGDRYILQKPNDRFEEYIVAPNGKLYFQKGITELEDTLFKDKYTKVETDNKIKALEISALTEMYPLPEGVTVLPTPPLTGGVAMKNAWVFLKQGVTYTQTGGPNIVAVNGRDNRGIWNGTVWSLKDMGELPKGVDGKTLEIFDPLKVTGYSSGAQVIFEEVIYEIIPGQVATTGQSPITNPEKFKAIFTGGSGSSTTLIVESDSYLKKGSVIKNKTTNIWSFNGAVSRSYTKPYKVFAGTKIQVKARLYDPNTPMLIFMDDSGTLNADTVVVYTTGTTSVETKNFIAPSNGWVIAQADLVSTTWTGQLKIYDYKDPIEYKPVLSSPKITELDLVWEPFSAGDQGPNSGQANFNHSTSLRVRKGDVFAGIHENGGDFIMFRVNNNGSYLGNMQTSVSSGSSAVPLAELFVVEYDGWLTINKGSGSTVKIIKYEGLDLLEHGRKITKLPESEGFTKTGHVNGISDGGLYSLKALYPVKAGDIVRTVTIGTYPMFTTEGRNFNIISPYKLNGYKDNKGQPVKTYNFADGSSGSFARWEVEAIIPVDGYIVLLNQKHKSGPEGFIKMTDADDSVEIITKAKNEFIQSREVQMIDSKYLKIHCMGILPGLLTSPNKWQLVKMYERDRYVGMCYATLAVQGAGSAGYAKKGYTFEPYTEDQKSIKFKIGTMPATDSFHFKAYYTDQTMSRDLGNGRLWHQMARTRNYPENFIHNKPEIMQGTMTPDVAYDMDSKFFTDGTPAGFYVNGEFYGLHVLRLKKHRSNYGMDKADPRHIFLDAATYTAYLNNGFTYQDWEVRNPKLSGYDGEMQPVPAGPVLDNINRLFNWLKGVSDGTIDPKTTHQDYIILSSWLDWMIICEVIGNWDVNGNNYNIMTWDATRWSMMLYDTDATFGIMTGQNTVVETRNSWCLPTTGLFPKLKLAFITEIRERYTWLRKNNILTMQNAFSIYRDGIMSNIPQSAYIDNFAKWGGIGGFRLTDKQLFKYLNSRFIFLDTNWLNT